MAPELPLTILGANLLEVMFLHLSRKWEKVPTCTADDDVDELLHYTLFLLRINTTSWWFPVILTAFKFSFKVRLICWRCTTKISQRQLLDIKLEPCFGPGFATSVRSWSLWQTRRLSLCLYQHPLNVTIRQASTHRKVSSKLWGKGKCEAQTS